MNIGEIGDSGLEVINSGKYLLKHGCISYSRHIRDESNLLHRVVHISFDMFCILATRLLKLGCAILYSRSR